MRLKLLLQRGEDATDRQDYVVLYLIDKKYTSRLVLLLKKHHQLTRVPRFVNRIDRSDGAYNRVILCTIEQFDSLNEHLCGVLMLVDEPTQLLSDGNQQSIVSMVSETGGTSKVLATVISLSNDENYLLYHSEEAMKRINIRAKAFYKQYSCSYAQWNYNLFTYIQIVGEKIRLGELFAELDLDLERRSYLVDQDGNVVLHVGNDEIDHDCELNVVHQHPIMRLIVAKQRSIGNDTNYLLDGYSVATKYAPCHMCCMALVHARVRLLVVQELGDSCGGTNNNGLTLGINNLHALNWQYDVYTVDS